MDPQSAWDQLLDAYADEEWDTVLDLAEGLQHWLHSGGFPPRAVTGCDLGPDWDREVALTGCRLALAKAKEGMTYVP